MSNLDHPTTAELGVWITVRQGLQEGQRFAVKRFPLVIGRGNDCDVRLEDDQERPTISRHHARIDLSGGRFTLEDLSTNGTWLHSHHLDRGEVVVLRGGDEVWLGSHTRISLDIARQSPSGNLAAGRPGPPQVPLPSDPTPTWHSIERPHFPPERPSSGRLHQLNIQTLGRFAVFVDGVVVPESAWVGRKAVALLVYLAENEGRMLSKERLYEALWSDERGTPQALQTAVSRVRHALRQGHEHLLDPLRCEHNQYGLNDAYQIDYDARSFDTGCKAARHGWEEGKSDTCEQTLRATLALYAGEFMPGANEDWVALRRSTLAQAHAEAILALAILSESQGNLSAALELYQGLLAQDAARESAHEGVIRCLARTGRRDEALRQYQKSLGDLKRVLNLEPGRALMDLRDALANQHELPAAPPPYS